MYELSPGPPSNSRRASPLRIALLVDSPIASKYVYAFTQWAQSHRDIIVTHLVVHPPPKVVSKFGASLLQKLFYTTRRSGRCSAIAELAFLIVMSFERILIKLRKRHSDHQSPFDLSSLVNEAITITPHISKFVYRFDDADVQRVKELRLDLLLRCGDHILQGDILNASRFGIISVHHADNRINRGGPTGFWEVFYRQETTGFTIKRLTERADAGDVLMRGNFATCHYCTLNQAFLFSKSNYYLKLVIEKIASTDRLPNFLPEFPYSQRLYRLPKVHETGIYFARLLYTLLMKKVRSLLGIHYRWNVAYVHGDWKSAELFRGIRLKNQPFHYLADPFAIHRDGKNYCFVEDLDYVRQRGSIAVYELTNVGGVRIGTALEEKFHLSFPYLFEYAGELYMCPESSENKDIRIYKCIEFPLRWRLEKIIMEKVSAVDTMLFEKDGKWWMFTNIDPADIGDYGSELFIFSGESPLDTTWKPHILNPIVVDASRARNAGRVPYGNGYFRFSQGQGFDFYGKRILINQIRELTETSYREECMSVIAPSFGDGIVGTHHLHSDGWVTVFDFATSSRIHTEDGA
jgi:hypothetical protein